MPAFALPVGLYDELRRALLSYSLSFLEFVNLYHGVTYAHHKDYRKTMPPRDYALQLGFTLLGLSFAIYFIQEGLRQVVGVPLVTASTLANPSPSQMLDLFRGLEAFELSAVDCPCTSAGVPLSDVSSWEAVEDSFCTGMRESMQQVSFQGPLPAFNVFSLFESMQSLNNSHCIATPALPGINPAWDAFVANVTQLTRAGGLFDAATEDEDTQLLAAEVQRGLCGAAFGSITEVRAFEGGAIPTVGTASFSSLCGSDNEPNLGRWFPTQSLGFSSSTETRFIQLQQSRAFSFVRGAVAACSALSLIRSEFLDAVAFATLPTPAALSPSALALAVESLWLSTLSARAEKTAAFVPGFDLEDRIAQSTDATPNMGRLVLDYFGTNTEGAPLSEGSFPFSSRLPFSRADFVSGGSRVFYVTGRSNASTQSWPAATRFLGLAGYSRLVAATDFPETFPFVQTLTGFAGSTTRGFVPGVTKGWVPLGSDWISLLDACHKRLPLSLDVHNLRPVQWAADAPPQSSMERPFGSIRLGPSPGLGPDSLGNRCSMGSAPPAAPNPFAPAFSSPVQCPPLLQWLGGLRANSSYVNSTSPVRVTIQQYLDLFPPPTDTDTFPLLNLTTQQAEFLEGIVNGDLGQRAQLFSLLGIVSTGPTFQHKPLLHYAACAPSECVYSQVSKQSTVQIALTAFGILGGNVSITLSLLGWLLLGISYAAQKWCTGGQQSEEKQRLLPGRQ